MSNSTLILGIGNTLLTDEAAGVRVVEALRERSDLPDDVELLDGGTLSFTLAGPIADAAHLIVVDAAITGNAPGTVGVYEGAEMDRLLTRKAKSVHEVSLGDLMDMARLSDTLPVQRALVAIEPQVVDWGSTLTEPVEAAVAQAVEAVYELVRRWHGE